MEELQIKVERTPGTITTNFAEIEANLKVVLANYKGIIVTEDTVKQSKKDVAELRKIRAAIDDEKKKVKKLWNEPYTIFEDKCKALMALVDEPISEINNQVAEFEAKRLDEKKKHLKALYEENISECAEYLPFAETLADKWQNVSYADKDYLYDLSEKKTRIKSDLSAIQSLASEIENEVLEVYKRTGNLSAAIQKNSDYLQAKAKAEEKVREEQKAIPTVPKEPKQVLVDVETGEVIPEFTFRVSGSDYINQVKEYLQFAEIPFIEV